MPIMTSGAGVAIKGVREVLAPDCQDILKANCFELPRNVVRRLSSLNKHPDPTGWQLPSTRGSPTNDLLLRRIS